MRVSKFIKAHKDILLEYIYDDNNNIGEPYKVLVNIKNNTYSYIAGGSSVTSNTINNQLFQIDPVTNNYGLVDISNYSFLQVKDYSSGFPVRHDTLKIHLPINYTFGEYIGCYVKVYTYDYENKKTYDLSNFFFDTTNIDQSYLLNYTTPAFLFQEKLWGKNLTINIPSVFSIANQRQNGSTKPNSINFNLTNGVGLSINSPIFIDFQFITSKKTINTITTYYLNAKTPISLPQTPEFEKIGVKVEHSLNGDYFEIYGVYNDNIAEFKNFIDNSVQLGNRYYIEYNITLYEQNIRGKSIKMVVTDNFNEKIEYRPIIKYSTTTAIIDVEMNVIDAVDESAIFRRASYGMLQDEVSKYSINLTKINIANAHKPKIYNIKSPQGAGIFSNGNGLNTTSTRVMLEPIKVNYTVLADRYNVVAKSDNVIIGKTNFFGMGKLQLVLYPFDNVIQLIIAQDVSSEQTTNDSGNGGIVEFTTAPLYMDMTNMGEIKMVIKNSQTSVENTLYMASNQVDLASGVVVFKIPGSKMNDIKKIYDSGFNVFYITGTLDSGTTVLYSGLFVIYDSKDNIINLNNASSQMQSNLINAQSSIISDPNSTVNGTAIVTRKLVQSNTSLAVNSSSISVSTTSSPISTKFDGVVFGVQTDSSIMINGYNWTSSELQRVLGLPSPPTNLTIKDTALYSNDQYLAELTDISNKLTTQVLVSQDMKDVHSQVVSNFVVNASGTNKI